METTTINQVWLTVAEVSDKLGLSKMTVYRMINERKLPAYKFGRAFRVKLEDFNSYVENSIVA